MNDLPDEPPWRRILPRTLHRPLWSAVLTVLLAVIGVAGSVYSDELRSAWPLAAWTLSPGGVSLVALVFWTGLAGTAFLFFGRQVRVDQRRAGIDQSLKQAVGEVQGSVQTVKESGGLLHRAVGDVQESVQTVRESGELLHRTIRTMPPSAFLQVFDAVYETCEEQTWEAVTAAEPTRDDLILTVRTVLYGFLRLTEMYDNQPWSPQGQPPTKSRRYAANVMVYVPVEHLRDGDEDVLREGHLKFWDGSYADLKGVLDIRTDLSAASDSESGDPDLAAFCLPVPRIPKPKQPDGAAPWRVLPGAPMAFQTERPAHFRETAELAAWCEEKGDFRRTVRTALDEYFQSDAGHLVQSFVAYPLSRGAHGDRPPDEVAAPPVGVLNIHADVPKLLDGDDARSFYATTYPLRVLLIRLLERLVSLDDVGEAGQWVLNAPARPPGGAVGRGGV